MISRTVDKLPTWAQVVLLALAIPVFAYEIAHYGFWSALLRFIFSPTL